MGRLDIEEFGMLRRTKGDFLTQDICYFFTHLFSSIKGCELVGKHWKCALAVLFLMLEAMSFLLEVVGSRRGKWSILLAAFLLSAFVFVMTIFTCILERKRVHAEKQLGLVEVVFSVVQLTATFLAVLGIKIMTNYTASILLLVFAIISVVFVKKDGSISGSSLVKQWSNGQIELISEEDLSLLFPVPTERKQSHAIPSELELSSNPSQGASATLGSILVSPSRKSTGPSVTSDIFQPGVDGAEDKVQEVDARAIQQILIQHVAASLTRDPNFTAALAASASERVVAQCPTEKGETNHIK